MNQNRKRERTLEEVYEVDGLETPAQLRRVLHIALIGELGLENSHNRSRTLIALVGAAVRLNEQGELARQLAEIQEVLGQRPQPDKRHRWWSRVSLRTRLSSLAPTLTARERALLLVRCLKEDRDEDESIRRDMPNSQARELNQYVGLMNSANRDLGALCRVLTIEVEGLEQRHQWFQLILDWQATAGELAPLLDELRDDLKETLRAHLSHRWQELRALETVWDEIAKEFGEDPVHGSYRGETASNKATVQRLTSSLKRKPALSEPSEEMVDATRDLVRRAKEFVI